MARLVSDGNDVDARARPFVNAAEKAGTPPRTSDRTTRERDGRSEAGRARTLTTRMTPTAVPGAREDPDTIDRETDAGCCDASTRAWLQDEPDPERIFVARRYSRGRPR